jgi:phosphoglycerol transferase MdoB-like AlkP superfamily enzyme
VMLTVLVATNSSFTVSQLCLIFLVGFAYDVITFCYLSVPAVLILLLIPDRWIRSGWLRRSAITVYFVVIFIFLFNAVAEWLFWREFDARFNFVTVDYLVYTRELINNIRESYPIPTIMLFLGVFTALIFAPTLKPFLRMLVRPTPWRARIAPALLVSVIVICSVSFLDDEDVRLSINNQVNELSHNGIYSLVDAFEDNVLDYDQYYLTQDKNAIFHRLRELLSEDNARFAEDEGPSIRRHIDGQGDERRLNVVMVVVESLSAKFLGAYGDQRHLTPNLDKIASHSVLFTNVYSTGTRTDRGLEALTLSVPPTPGRSIIKRPNNSHLFTLIQQFQKRGYDTRFLYGGFGYFDNMNSYFANNGAMIVDRSDLASGEITFANVWGVCDGDLYSRVLKECDRSFAGGRPFFSLVLTTSNHQPFTYPQTIDIPSGSGREGAVKYTDYAIGRFLHDSQSRPWFDSTLFVIVADHCARSGGKAEVTFANYHIPLMFYAPNWLSPRRIETISSQIDVAPTLLGALKFSYESTFFGHDILRSPQSRSLVGTYEKLGYSDGKQLMLLLPQHRMRAFRMDNGEDQQPCHVDSQLKDEAIAYYQGAYYLLSHGLYR